MTFNSPGWKRPHSVHRLYLVYSQIIIFSPTFLYYVSEETKISKKITIKV